MSWQLAAFTILFVALAGGFAWYEHRRPDARVIALVGTLAAFAALGRIAFAAVPNVKPTTVIVLVTGYALGAGPGFAVGALAGLTSNFFFGQGPWTPWQMAAWGATGVIGAALAQLSGRRIGRWPLAITCAVVGFAFTAFQDVGDWVTYSDHSLRALGVYVAQGLGFDAVHAVGCLLFALALGPAMVRSISRFARRLDVTWIAPGSAIVPVLVAVLAGGAAAGLVGRTAGTADAAASPASYLQTAQNANGGLGAGPGQPSSQLYSGWAALGLAAEGINPQRVRRGGASLSAYLAAGVHAPTDPGSLERAILALHASGLDPSSVGGRNLVAALQGDFKRDGSIARQTNWTAFAVLALRAAGVPPPARTLAWLARQQDRNGGFGFGTAGGASDVDDTGAALEALAGARGRRAARDRSQAIAYIGRHQDRDGGFPSYPGEGSNAQSTAWAIQGLIAAGVDPSALHRAGAPSPLQYLGSLRAPDGHIRYSASSDQTPVWVTGEAMMALAGKALPIQPPPISTGHSAHTPNSEHGRPRRSSHRSKPGHPRRRQAARVTPAELTQKVVSYMALADAVALRPLGLG